VKDGAASRRANRGVASRPQSGARTPLGASLASFRADDQPHVAYRARYEFRSVSKLLEHMCMLKLDPLAVRHEGCWKRNKTALAPRADNP
jgi:hypothetical protein